MPTKVGRVSATVLSVVPTQMVYAAARLLRRMLKAGMSKYHPAPLAALKHQPGDVRFRGRYWV
jgi:hypothetical protein